MRDAVEELTWGGRRVVAVARRTWHGPPDAAAREDNLELVGLLGIEDPPRADVAAALASALGPAFGFSW